MNRVRNFLRYHGWLIFTDLLAFCVSYLLTLYIRFYVNGAMRASILYYQDYFWKFIPYYMVASLVVFVCFRLYRSVWQYAGVHDLNRILLANAVTAVLHVGISVLAFVLIPETKNGTIRMPVSYYIIGALIQLALTGITRFISRFVHEEKRRLSRKASVNVMLVGTGETGRIVRRQIEEDPNSGARIACIFSYRDFETSAMIDGVPIVRNLDLLKDHIRRYQIQRIIMADSIMPMDIRERIKTACQENGIEIQDFSGYLRYDSSGLSFQRLMECANGPIIVLCDDIIHRFENGEQAVMTLVEKHDVKSVSVRENSIFIELISYKVNPLIVYYITNRPDVALVAEKYGVDRIWIDLETRGKEDRQRNMNTVKSDHTVADIAAIKPLLTEATMMVRINPWYEGSGEEIESVIAAGAEVIMLPYWKTPDEVRSFLNAVHGRCRTSLLLETKEGVDCIDEILEMGGFDEIHIGLNDLHLSYGMSFMFEPLADGTVEMLCEKFKKAGVPFGFGGIARLGTGMLPAERIIMEHYRLGSTRAILSRSFCDCAKVGSIEEIDRIFRENMEKLREYELAMANTTQEEFVRNKIEISKAVDEIVERINLARNNGL